MLDYHEPQLGDQVMMTKIRFLDLKEFEVAPLHYEALTQGQHHHFQHGSFSSSSTTSPSPSTSSSSPSPSSSSSTKWDFCNHWKGRHNAITAAELDAMLVENSTCPTCGSSPTRWDHNNHALVLYGKKILTHVHTDNLQWATCLTDVCGQHGNMQ